MEPPEQPSSRKYPGKIFTVPPSEDLMDHCIISPEVGRMIRFYASNYPEALHTGQPVNADCAAGGVPPELDELLNGEYASQILDRSAVLCMTALEQPVGLGIPGEPADVGNADDVAVQIGF